MIIYCNGDSFISGVELADSILPEYPGARSRYDFKKEENNKRWIDRSYNQNDYIGKKRTELLEKIFHLEYEKAWPNKIQNKTGIRVINNSRGGSSLDRIIRVCLTDLIELLSTNKKIIAIIGTTDPNRQEVPINAGNINELDWVGQNKHWEQISSSYRNPSQLGPIDHIIDYKIEFETTYHQLVKAYTNIITLQDFCKLNNIELHWISSQCNILKLLPEKRILNQQDLDVRKIYSNFKYSFDFNLIAESMSYTDEIYCPANHYSEIVHEKLSNLIIEDLKLL